MSVQGVTLAAVVELNENRIETIASQLSEKPAAFGLPIDNRRVWKKLLEDDSFRNVISEAEKLLEQAIPKQPCDFGTALITFDKWQQLSDSSLVIRDQDKALRVDIEVTGADPSTTLRTGFKMQPETIEEDLSGNRLPTRLGINLTRPVLRAVISLTISPAG